MFRCGGLLGLVERVQYVLMQGRQGPQNQCTDLLSIVKSAGFFCLKCAVQLGERLLWPCTDQESRQYSGTQALRSEPLLQLDALAKTLLDGGKD